MLEKSNIEVAEITTDGSKRSIPQETTVCSSKGQALQLTYSLDFLSIQTEAVVDGESIEGKC